MMENTLDLLELSEATHQALYSAAVKKTLIGDYAKAITLLQFLVVTALSNSAQYTKALAGCLHETGKLTNAVEFYQITYADNPEIHADCLLYSADCLLKLDLPVEAINCLDQFLELHVNNPTHVQWLAKAKLLHKIASKKALVLHNS